MLSVAYYNGRCSGCFSGQNSGGRGCCSATPQNENSKKSLTLNEGTFWLGYYSNFAIKKHHSIIVTSLSLYLLFLLFTDESHLVVEFLCM